MDASWIRELCLSFPAVTEHVIWGSDLTFKVAGKMFAHTVLEPAPAWLSFKASPDNFYDLTERPGVIPALERSGSRWKRRTRFLPPNWRRWCGTPTTLSLPSFLKRPAILSWRRIVIPSLRV
jgi:hypothetical protein